MFCIIFESDKAPEIWETAEEWPGALNLKYVGAWVFFTDRAQWGRWNAAGLCPLIPTDLVPPEYRATALLLA